MERMVFDGRTRDRITSQGIEALARIVVIAQFKGKVHRFLANDLQQLLASRITQKTRLKDEPELVPRNGSWECFFTVHERSKNV